MEDKLQYGKILPQCLDIEEAILGQIMINQNSVDRITDIIKPKSFYKDTNRIIFESILYLRQKNEPIDLLTVTNNLKICDQLELVGGAFNLTRITSSVSLATNIEYHAAVLHEYYLYRELIKHASELLTKSFDTSEDVFDLIADSMHILSSLSGFDRAKVKHIKDVFPKIVKQIDRNITNTQEITGIATGIKTFDNFSNGLQNGDMIIIAGETSNGKTALALNIGQNAAELGEKVVVYSYEMSDRQLAARILATETLVSSKEILYSKLNKDKINNVLKGVEKLSNQNIYIDELVSSKYEYLEKSIRSMVTKEGATLIIVDYLQLIKMTVKGFNKVDAVAEIANNIKGLARVLNVPIILLSQLSRDRTNPIPTLSRLKGSGDIENAADIIWLLWQPSIYNRPDFDCMNGVYTSEKNSHHIIAKGRNIGTTEFVLGFNPELTKFTNDIHENYEPVDYHKF